MGSLFFKRVIKSFKRRILSFFYKTIPLKNYILFESLPDFQDSSRAVFEEMLKRNINKKYKLIWVLSRGCKNYPKYDNVEYVDINSKKFMYYHNVAKLMFSCNNPLLPLRKKQISVNLWHGTPIKAVRWLVDINKWTLDKFTYFLSPSKDVIKILSHELVVPEDKFVPLGLPRNDIMTCKERDLHGMFDVDFKKVIVCYPTFRQGINSTMNSYSEDSLPIIHEETVAIRLNEFLKKNKVLLVIKPHFAQVLSKFTVLELEYIKFIRDDFFLDNNITSYELVASADAFLTDYSSIYYDYTLRDKPIGLLWEDIEDYKKRPGFVTTIDFDYSMQGGVKIYNIDDLENFIADVVNNKDTLKNERREIRDMANYSNDGKNSERVVDFVMKKLEGQVK